MSTIRVNAIQNTNANSGNMLLHANGNVSMTTSNTTLFIGNTAISNAGISVGGVAVNPFGGKNRIINGDFKIWQRSSGSATSVTSNGVGYTGPDRFFLYQNNVSPGVQSVRVAGPTGFQYALKWGRPSGNTKTDVTVMGQALETSNSIDLAGQTITLSFWAKAGDNFSSSANGLYVSIYSGTGTDQSASNMTTASWTGSATPIATTQTLTTTWTRYTFTGTLGSTVSQLGLYMNWVPTGTAGADDYVYITGIQLEVGSVATPFEFRQYGTERALCERYYIDFRDVYPGFINSGTTTVIRFTLPLPVEMRASPTVTYYGVDAGYSTTNLGGSGNTKRINTEISASARTDFRPGLSIRAEIEL